MPARSVGGLATVLLALTWTLACGGTSAPAPSAENFGLINGGTLIVSTWGTYPPYVVVTGDTIGGVDGALINAFAADHHLKVQLFTTSMGSAVLALQQKKADMGASFFWSTARAQQAFFTLPFFADYGINVIYKSTFTYTDPSSLQGKKVGTIVGSILAPYVQKTFGSNAIVYQSIVQEATALINGQVDAIIESTSIASTPPLAGRSDIKLTPVKVGDFGMPAELLVNYAYNIVQCGNTKLADGLDAEYLKLTASGAWQKILTDNNVTGGGPSVAQERPAQGCSG